MSNSLSDFVARFTRDGVWDLVPSARDRAVAATTTPAQAKAAAESAPDPDPDPSTLGEAAVKIKDSHVEEAGPLRDAGYASPSLFSRTVADVLGVADNPRADLLTLRIPTIA